MHLKPNAAKFIQRSTSRMITQCFTRLVNQYLEEIKELISAINEDRPVKVLVPESTKETLDLALAEIKSAQTGEPVYL